MSDRTQDLKNLRAVATACKNYVDETKEQILWQVGQYNITTQDDNTSAYQKIVPAGATRAKLKSIGFMSYKSENLIVLSDVAENTLANGVTYKITNGEIAFKGTNTASLASGISIVINQNIPAGTYSLSLFNNAFDITQDVRLRFLYTDSTNLDIYINAKNYANNNVVLEKEVASLYIRLGSFSNVDWVILKPMLVSGSTAPTEWKQGFTGIRDSAVTSVKSYDSNNNLIDTYTIPSEIQALEGYGRGINENCYNTLDLNTKVFTDKDSVVDLGTGTYTYQYSSFYTYSFTGYAYQQGQVKFLCSAYKEFNYNGSLADFTATDKNITFTANNMVWITDKQYGTDATTFKNNASGVKLQYEKATYTTTNVSQYIDNNVIEVEEGGYLVFENQYGQAVPSNVTYRIEVAR